ncbi:MAG: ABC transporter ATP-binding protein [Chloroflexota bacterium]|nr:ABC transporter ATP-binding protein [Chloroflexota bacterium]MDP9470173.1 ABC transporter ATP-binding protein [Chloroflexota bacterium]
MPGLLELDGVSKRFGGLDANRDVSFTVGEGQIVGLIGPNGAGKTTLFNCVSGFFPPTSGSIRFAGQEIAGWPAEKVLRAGLARTFQVVRSFAEMTVLDNVMIGAFARTNRAGEARARATELLAFTGLAARAKARGADLTIADKKRLELTRALATQPRLLMLDEVMAGLNPAERAQAVQLIRAIRDRGTTVLLVEHVMEVVMPISDHVVVLDSGRKIAEGPPQVVVRNPNVIAAYLGEKYRPQDGETA